MIARVVFQVIRTVVLAASCILEGNNCFQALLDFFIYRWYFAFTTITCSYRGSFMKHVPIPNFSFRIQLISMFVRVSAYGNKNISRNGFKHDVQFKAHSLQKEYCKSLSLKSLPKNFNSFNDSSSHL